MPEFFEDCRRLFQTDDFYAILGLSKGQKPGEKELKKAYKKLSLKVHPDRVGKKQKAEATQKFQLLSKVYSILSDKEKRAVYDETGEIDEEGDIAQDRDWVEYWRLLFAKVEEADIDNFEKKYKGSAEERNDIKEAYSKCKGNMDAMLEHIMCSSVQDEPRYRSLINEMIDNKEVPKYSAFTKESKEKQQARKRKAEEEAKEVENLKSKKKGEESLHMQIQKRQENRAQQMNDFFSQIEKKYAAADAAECSKKKSKKGKNKSNNAKPPPKKVRNKKIEEDEMSSLDGSTVSSLDDDVQEKKTKVGKKKSSKMPSQVPKQSRGKIAGKTSTSKGNSSLATTSKNKASSTKTSKDKELSKASVKNSSKSTVQENPSEKSVAAESDSDESSSQGSISSTKSEPLSDMEHSATVFPKPRLGKSDITALKKASEVVQEGSEGEEDDDDDDDYQYELGSVKEGSDDGTEATNTTSASTLLTDGSNTKVPSQISVHKSSSANRGITAKEARADGHLKDASSQPIQASGSRRATRSKAPSAGAESTSSKKKVGASSKMSSEPSTSKSGQKNNKRRPSEQGEGPDDDQPDRKKSRHGTEKSRSSRAQAEDADKNPSSCSPM